MTVGGGANRVFFTNSWSAYRSDTTPRRMRDIVRFTREIGFKPVIHEAALRGTEEFFRDMVSYWRSSDVFLCVYPHVFNPVGRGAHVRAARDILFPWLRELGRSRRRTSILYVADLPIENNVAIGNIASAPPAALEAERAFLEAFDAVLVFNRAMGDAIRTKSARPGQRVVEFSVLDLSLRADLTATKGIGGDVVVAYVGNLRRDFMGEWPASLPSVRGVSYRFYGTADGAWLNALGRADAKFMGRLPDTQLTAVLAAEAHWGVVDFSAQMRPYFKYGSTAKFSNYLVAGVPVLVPAALGYVASLVREHGLGLVYDGPESIPGIAKGASRDEYAAMRSRCIAWGKRINSGEFIKGALERAIGGRAA